MQMHYEIFCNRRHKTISTSRNMHILCVPSNLIFHYQTEKRLVNDKVKIQLYELRRQYKTLIENITSGIIINPVL